jgi:hypothetical protein
MMRPCLTRISNGSSHKNGRSLGHIGGRAAENDIRFWSEYQRSSYAQEMVRPEIPPAMLRLEPR